MIRPAPWWLRLASYGRPHRGGLASLLALAVAGAAFEALKPWPLKLIVDYVVPHRPLPQRARWLEALPGAGSGPVLLGWLAGGTLLVFLAGWLVRALRAYTETGIGTRMTWALGADLFDRAQRLSPSFHSRGTTGDLIQRVTKDTRAARELTLGVAVPLLTSAATLLLMLRLLWRLDALLSLVAFGAVLPLALLVRLLAGRVERNAYAESQRQGETLAMAEQTLTALPMVQAFGGERHEDGRFRALAEKSGASALRTIASNLQMRFGVSAVTAMGTTAVMLLGGLRALEHELTVGDLLVFLSYLSSLYAPLESLAYLGSGFSTAAASARRVLEVLDAPEPVTDLPGARALELPRGHGAGIRLENVSFAYEAGRPALQDVSLEVAAGECVALVGPTGAGKTTLLSLIPRFHDPSRGRVTVDGRDLRELTLESLRRQVALVLQESLLLPVSIAENIAYGRPEATREEIVAAATAAEAHDFIARLPRGYDSELGARGATLSVGERQRLGLARALLRDAPILLLDEPTASLDAENERRVVAALGRLIEGRTCILVAHRPSTVRLASRVITLRDGAVVENRASGAARTARSTA